MVKKWSSTLLLLLAGFTNLLAQDMFENKREFLAGVSYFNVVNTWNRFFKDERNHGVGLFAEYRFPLIKKWKINAHATAGVDKITDCNLCKSGWYNESVWIGAGLGTFINVAKRHVFTAQLRARVVGFERTEAWLFIDGNPIEWSTKRDLSTAVGVKLGYQLPIDLPLELSYAFEGADGYANINTFSLAWRFTK